MHPTNVGVPNDGCKTVMSGVPHVEKTVEETKVGYSLYDTDMAPGLVHKGTLSVALIVTVSILGYGT